MNLKKEYRRAKVLYEQGKAEMALSLCDRILSTIPKDFDTLLLSGTIDCGLSPERAIKKLSLALSLRKDSVVCLNSLSTALISMEQYEIAQTCARHALAINRNYWPAYGNLAVSLAAMNDHLGACNCYDQAIKLASDVGMLYSNRANSLTKLQRFDEALADYETAFKTGENSAIIHLNYGHLLEEVQKFSSALAAYNRAIEIDPTNAEARYNRSLLNLYLKNFKEGWAEHDWRWKRKKLDTIPFTTEKPVWTRTHPKGRVLVWAEQGVGDHIFFSSFLKELCADTTKVLVTLDPRLLSLFRRSFPKIEFFSLDNVIAEDLYDYHIAMADLAAQYRPSIESYNCTVAPYLYSDPERVSVIKSRLHEEFSIHKDSLIVGISWSSKNSHSGSKRSLELEALAQAISKKNICLVNLQYGEVSNQLKQLKNNCDIEVLSFSAIDNTNDLDGLAALMQACDLVISADNSTVHLAGALGKPTWICLPAVSNWRWFVDGRESPWFPATTLYRQDHAGQWTPVLSQISLDVVKLLHSVKNQ